MIFKPMLFRCGKDLTKEQVVKDMISGVIVAIIALPLSIALALASGVTPENGLYTAIVAGFIISMLGGSRVQIAGPTAAFATIVAGIVAKNGMDGLVLATIMAGIILVIMGFLRLGSLIRFIPATITTGFTAGIAVTIAIGQLKDFCGVSYPAGMPTIETMEKLAAFGMGIKTLNLWALLVGGICLAILILWPKINATVPASLIAVVVGSLVVKLLDLPVNTIGDLYTIHGGLPTFHLPGFDFETVVTVLPDAFTIAVLAAIESLLSCVVADGMIDSRHDSNTELIAQGLGNMASALFGGIPATGAIARTAANIKSGGRTPIAGMVHALVLLLIMLVLMPYAALIPMPTIAAILFIVAYNMCQWRPFLRLVKTAPKSDICVLVVTFFLTVVFDLVVAIEVGMVLACLLFMKRMSDETNIRSWTPAETDTEAAQNNLRRLPRSIKVYEISGPLFFGASGRIADILLDSDTKCLVLRMRSVPALDATALGGLEELLNRCRVQNVRLILSHVNEQPLRSLRKADFIEQLGEENLCACIDDALALAEGKSAPAAH